MSIFDALRSFMGFLPKKDGSQDQREPWNFFIDENNVEEDDFDELYTDRSFNSNRGNFGFRMFSGDVLEMHRFFEQQFDDIIKSFQSNWFQDVYDHNYGMTPIEEGSSVPDEGNPRNRFLKPAYIQPSLPNSAQIDQEVEHKVPPSKVLDLFPDKGEAEKRQSSQLKPFTATVHSSFSSQIIKKKVLPNGGVEEERKCIRNGKEETTLSRQLDGMKHIVTKSRLPDGTTETHEEFVNMDEYKLADFNKAWSSNNRLPKPSNPNENSPNPNLPDSNISLLDILRQFI